MKSTFSSAAITIVVLLFTAFGNAQDNPPAPHQPVFPTPVTDTLKKIITENRIASTPVPDSQKVKKVKKRNLVQKEFYNLYQPYNPATIAPRYNSSLPFYKQPEETILTGVGKILISLLADKTRH